MAIWHRAVWANIGSVVTNPVVAELHRLWQQARQAALTKQADALPSALVFSPETLSAHASKLMVLLPEGDRDFRYAHYGSDIRQHSQFDMTGKVVSEFGGELSEFFLARYTEVVEKREPLYTVHYADRAKSVLTWERLVLPLQHPEGGISLLVYNTPLETRHALLEAVLNATNDGILALRPVNDEQSVRVDWLIMAANKQACHMLNTQHPQPVGFNVSQVFANWRQWGLDAHGEAGLRSAHGVGFSLEVQATPQAEARSIKGRSSAVGDGCVISLQDVTQQRNYENLLWDARHEAEAAAMSKANFLASMSHEIRTPMNGIIGMTSLLLDTPLVQEQTEFVEVIRSSSESLLVIINDILDYSKIESGNMQLDWMPLDVQELVESSIDLLSTAAQRKKLDLIYFIEDDVPRWIYGDATRLRQVLVNLISNAIKFTAQGEVFVHIKRTDLSEASSTRGAQDSTNEPQDALRPDPIALELSITDTGVGISQLKQQRLFLPFSQGDSSTSREFGGTGLGLAICKRLVEGMGGRIGVESEPDQGSRFMFTLRSEPAPERMDSVRMDTSSLKGLQVLLLDDNATNLRVLTLQMQRWGAKPHAFADAEEALANMSAGHRFDVALSDMHMPMVNGFEFAKLAKDIQPDLPVVVLSSVHQRQPPEPGLIAGFLLKPARQSSLFDAVMLAVHQHAPQRLRNSSRAPFDPNMARNKPLRILLVEDNEVNTKVALKLLSGFGYRADVAGDGVEALEAMRRQPYDVILMDIQMPRMDGLEATRRVIDLAATYDQGVRPRIIGLSANAMRDEISRAKAAGMDDYITKPITVSALAEALACCTRLTAARYGALLAGFHSSLPDLIPANPRAEAAARSSAYGALEPRLEQVLDAERLDPIIELDAQGEFLAELTASFAANVQDLIQKMQRAWSERNGPELSRIAHQVKGLAANLGVMHLSRTCGDLETLANTGELGGLQLLLERAQAQFNQGVQALTARVAEIRAQQP
jgi:signal transduction histidine kinase/CheY-like chemotaxis protein